MHSSILCSLTTLFDGSHQAQIVTQLYQKVSEIKEGVGQQNGLLEVYDLPVTITGILFL